MTKITLLSHGCEFSAQTESEDLNAEALVDMFGGLMIANGYVYETVCDVLNTETFHFKEEE